MCLLARRLLRYKYRFHKKGIQYAKRSSQVLQQRSRLVCPPSVEIRKHPNWKYHGQQLSQRVDHCLLRDRGRLPEAEVLREEAGGAFRGKVSDKDADEVARN